MSFLLTLRFCTLKNWFNVLVFHTSYILKMVTSMQIPYHFLGDVNLISFFQSKVISLFLCNFSNDVNKYDASRVVSNNRFIPFAAFYTWKFLSSPLNSGFDGLEKRYEDDTSSSFIFKIHVKYGPSSFLSPPGGRVTLFFLLI